VTSRRQARQEYEGDYYAEFYTAWHETDVEERKLRLDQLMREDLGLYMQNLKFNQDSDQYLAELTERLKRERGR
jgi:hypothetical protein